jgi:acid stress-induced BolA-like protein IbaG/YrbA
MVSPEQIKHYIESGLTCEHVEVAGDGHHFEAVIVSAAFRGKSRVKQHQLVYRALGDRMRADDAHSDAGRMGHLTLSHGQARHRRRCPAQW